MIQTKRRPFCKVRPIARKACCWQAWVRIGSVLLLLGMPALVRAGSTERVIICDPVSVSVMNTTQAIIKEGAGLLPNQIAERIREDTGSEIQARTGKASKPDYTPPSDDDLSFAGGDDVELGKQLSEAYPTPDPLVLITVAERGTYLITAAYIARDTGANARQMTRVYRQAIPVQGITGKHLSGQVACISSKITEALGGPAPAGAAGGPPCDQPTRTAAATPGVGMLEGVTEGAMVVIPTEPGIAATGNASAAEPATTPAASAAAPGSTAAPPIPKAPKKKNQQVAAPKPPASPQPAQVKPPGQRDMLPNVVTVQPPLAPSGPSALEEQLALDVFRYGYAWEPSSSRKGTARKAIQSWLTGLSKMDQDCVARTSLRLGGANDVATVMLESLKKPTADPIKVVFDPDDLFKTSFQVTMRPRKFDNEDPRSCAPTLSGSETVLDVQLAARPGQMSRQVDKDYWLNADSSTVERLRVDSGWHYPNPIQAFLISEALKYSSTYYQKFWFKLGDRYAIFDLNKRDYYLGARGAQAAVLVVKEQ